MAEQIEIANAYIALQTKLPGAKKSIEQALGAPDVQGAADKAGRGVGSKLMGGVAAAGIGAAAAAGAAVVGTLGVALVKGFGRLEALDNADAKLTGLGHSAESVEAIMNNALASVKGTAFGMDEAATVAAGVVASGIKPGEDLERVLGLVADTATIAGTSMGDMGAIFNKVAAGGVLQGEEIAQLGDRGIPILQFLAEELGVTAQQAKDMASEGEISFETFAAAMEAGLGGAAQSSGDTFSGAMANVSASLGRIGAGLLGGTFDQLAPTFKAITEALGPLETVAGDVGVKIGEFLVPVFEGFRALLDGGFDFTPFMELLQLVSPLGLAFQVLQPMLPLIAEAFSQIMAVLAPLVSTVLSTLLPVLSGIGLVFAQLIAEVLPLLLPLLGEVANLFSALLTPMLPLLPLFLQLVEAVLPILVVALSALIPIVSGVVNAIGTLMIPIVNMLVDVLGGVITFLTGVFTGDWEKVWQGVGDIFTGIWEGLEDIGLGVVNALIDIINGFTSGLNEVGNFVSDITGGAIDVSIGQIPHLADGGIIKGSSTGTLALIGEAGPGRDEAVVPLPPDWRENGIGSGGGRTEGPLVVVNPAAGMDEAALGQVVGHTVAWEMRR